VNRTARNSPATISARSVAPSTTWLPEERTRESTHVEARSRTRSIVSRETSNGESSTSQASMSSTACETVSPSVAVSSAIGGTISQPSRTSPPRKSSNVAPAAMPFGSRRRSGSEIGVSNRTRNTAITTGTMTGESRRTSHSAASTAAAMTSSRHEYWARTSTRRSTRRAGSVPRGTVIPLLFTPES
jgi:hypothetical protein